MTDRMALLRLLGTASLLGSARTTLAYGSTDRSFTLNHCHIAGFRYYAGPTLLWALRPGDKLDLLAEPENPYDQFAVEVCFRGAKLGYLPRTENRQISSLLLQGTGLICTATSVDPEAAPWHAVEVEISLRTA